MRTGIRAGFLLGTMALLLAGCQNDARHVAGMRIELTALKEELRLLREQSDEVEPRVAAVETIASQLADERESPVTLDCARQGSASLRTQVVALTVDCEQIVDSADGHRLSLQVGNPTSARLEGVALTIYAGAGAARGRSATRVFQPLAAALLPGASVHVAVELPPLGDTATLQLAVRARLDRVQLVQK